MSGELQGGEAVGPSGDSCTIEAPAKVNLYLNVLGARPDGYHEIDTVMQTVDLTDTLEFLPRPEGGVTLSISGRTEGVPGGEGNLVMKAARLLERHVGARLCGEVGTTTLSPPRGEQMGAEIRLEKRIPSGSGLGGASSDAAAALVGLSGLWGLGWERDTLVSLAAELGSDVPFFILGGAARCTGRGEKVRWLRTEGELQLVLVFSGFLSTERIYRLWDTPGLTKRYPGGRFPIRVEEVLQYDGEWRLPRGGDNVVVPVSPKEARRSTVPLSRLNQLASSGELGDNVVVPTSPREPLWNSLSAAAFEARPELREVEQDLLDAGAVAAGVSGSGSCVFGLADSSEEARRIAEALGREAVAAKSLSPRDLG